jgi:periplasmic copper chaperone A
MTRHRAGALLAVVLLLVSTACGGSAGEAGTPDVEVRDATIALPAGRNTAIYFVIENRGDADDRLVGVTTDAGESIELHETRAGDDGLMRMHPLDEVDIPAGEVVVFEPGGRHVMVLDARDLVEGEAIPVALEFDRSGSVTVDATVRAYADLLDG